MKELSIEEKAKRYDDLLAKLQKAKEDNNVCDDRYCCVIDDIVPELKESEDERVRKALIKLVKKAGEGYENVIDGVSIENAISWLEKHGEQKEDDPPFNDPKYLAGFDTGREVQKIFDEQKPKWSEEDERMLGVAISDTFGNGHISVSDWLKSIKERVQPQSQWKPSDLQIKALEYYTKIGCVDKEGIYGSELVKLLEELKKL